MSWVTRRFAALERRRAGLLAPASVEKHITNIFAKLGLPPAEDTHRRVRAVLRYLDR